MKLESQPSIGKPNADETTMDRRAMFARTGALAALGGMAMIPGSAFAADNSEKSWNVHATLIESAIECVLKSEICVAHCISTFNEGSTMLAKCSGLTLQTVATCTTLVKLGTLGSPSLNDMARVCIATCKACEAECQLHSSHHEECKACAVSCRACIAECEKLVA